MKKTLIQILGAALLLMGGRLAVAFASATTYVYPEKDFGQFWLGLLILVASLVFVFALAVRHFWKGQVFAGIALLAILIVPFLFGTMIEGHYWRFLVHRTEYRSIVLADPTPSPKYRVFNWGNRNTQLMGGGFVIWAIVYDESDEISRPPQDWSTEWLARSLSQPKEDLWVIRLATSYPPCKRTTKTFDTHYYFVSEEC